MDVRCIACCVNASGEPEMVLCIARVDQSARHCGEHYDLVESSLEEHGYDVKLVADEDDYLFKQVEQSLIDTSGGSNIFEFPKGE